MQHFKITYLTSVLCSILFYLSVHTNAIGQTTATVQVTLTPNQTTEKQINTLFDGVDNEHLNPYLNDSLFATDTNNDN